MAGSFHSGHRLRTVLPSAARTTTTTSGDFSTGSSLYLRVRVVATAATATPSVVPKVQRKNPDGTYTDILAGAALTAAGAVVLDIGPGLPTTANVSANALITGTFRVVCTAADADSLTYSVTAETF